MAASRRAATRQLSTSPGNGFRRKVTKYGCPISLSDDEAFWIFHQPANVVVLCCRCHRLYDRHKIPRSEIVTGADQARRTLAGAAVVLDYFCRGWQGAIGSAQHGNVIHRWMRMLDWLKTMRDDGLLPEPHRFRISQVELVDLSTAEMQVEANVDPTSPMWTRNGFVTMQAPSSDATSKP